ncbi:UNVERIFIED_CONTAM: hypothetical protein GTU68_004813, partial [Idotea baltica]|nr:hypothetical protein [Idotea baltica]
ALFLAKVIFLLSWSKLVKVYTFLFSLTLIIFSYQANMTTIKTLSTMENSSHPALLQSLLSLNSSALWDSGGRVFCIASNYMVQAGVGLLFTTLTPTFQHSAARGIIILSFLLPTFSLLLPLPSSFKSSLPVFTALLPLSILNYALMKNVYNFYSLLMYGYHYTRIFLHDYGLHSLLETEWTRLNVPNVLRTFWDFMYVQGDYQSMFEMESNDFFLMFKEVMIYGCETSIALLGMTSIVSYLGHYVGVIFQAILMSDDDDERSMGTVCAILFFVLAEQSGLTVLEGDKRFIRLCRNFSFLFTAMLHFTHNMVNPVLMSLSASRNPVTHRHVRALSVSLVLVLFPCLLVYLLWNQYPLSTWLLAVSAFSVQVVVKTLVSLLIYSLFLIDAYRNNFWESLDDYVYYIRAFGNSVEFIFGILLFFTGAWIYFFESGGSIRASMMCIHAYFNIWCEAKNGWSVFMKRRTAVNKINSLPDATQEQLIKHCDVCAICFQDLQTAKITKCNHLFHSVCLRKWLYVQDSCPLCHATLYRTENTAEKTEEPEPAANDRNLDQADVSNPEHAQENSLDGEIEPEEEEEGIAWDHNEIEVILGEDLRSEDEAYLATSASSVQDPSNIEEEDDVEYLSANLESHTAVVLNSFTDCSLLDNNHEEINARHRSPTKDA